MKRCFNSERRRLQRKKRRRERGCAEGNWVAVNGQRRPPEEKENNTHHQVQGGGSKITSREKRSMYARQGKRSMNNQHYEIGGAEKRNGIPSGRRGKGKRRVKRQVGQKRKGRTAKFAKSKGGGAQKLKAVRQEDGAQPGRTKRKKRIARSQDSPGWTPAKRGNLCKEPARRQRCSRTCEVRPKVEGENATGSRKRLDRRMRGD